MWRRWNVAVGHFFFRQRNALFPAIFVCGALLLRPRVILSNQQLDRVLVDCGIIAALIGQAIRLATIGFEYIERGGKEGKVYASRLVQGGVYALMRNPMYVGNGLIAIGMSMVLGSPAAYFFAVPFFLFVYQAIVAAEEAYLRKRFGAEYDDYCAQVHRFLPTWRHLSRAFAGMRYDWKASIRKDLSTMAGLLAGLILVPLWRTYWLKGLEAAKTDSPRVLVSLAVVLVLYAMLATLKKRRLLFY